MPCPALHILTSLADSPQCKAAVLSRACVHAGLVNCTTIDWFTEWPADALYEVAAKQLADEDLGSQEIKSNMCQVGQTHVCTSSAFHAAFGGGGASNDRGG